MYNPAASIPPTIGPVDAPPGAPYAIWQGPHGVIRHVPFIYDDTYEWEQRFWHPQLVHSAFSHYWYASIAIVLVYVVGIHALQRWMRDRPPYSLRWQLVAWNASLALFSMVATWRLGKEFHHVLTERQFTDSVCLSISPAQPVAFWATLFALSKVVELMDTVFVVLRKRPLIFLQWYHHSVVLVYSWHGAKELVPAARWFMQMNFTVHSVMYTYYAITSTGYRLPRPISMLVTTLQTAQMLVGVGIALFVARLKISSPEMECQHSTENLVFCFAIYASFAFLFMRFFYNAYVRKGGKREGAKAAAALDNGRATANGASSNGASSNGASSNGASSNGKANGSAVKHDSATNGHAANGVVRRRQQRKAD